MSALGTSSNAIFKVMGQASSDIVRAVNSECVPVFCSSPASMMEGLGYVVPVMCEIYWLILLCRWDAVSSASNGYKCAFVNKC